MQSFDQTTADMRSCLVQAAEKRCQLAAHLDVLRETGADTECARQYLSAMDQMLAVMHEQMNLCSLEHAAPPAIEHRH